MRKLKAISKLMTILIPALFVIFGMVVYTTEYLGKGNGPGAIKIFLDKEITISGSVLMILIIIIAILWILSALCLISSIKIGEMIDDKEVYKKKMKH